MRVLKPALSVAVSSFLVLVVASTAFAQAPAEPGTSARAISPMSATTAAEIQKINEEMTLLNAQYSRLELKAKIAQKEKELKGTEMSFSSSPMGSAVGNPSVVSVSGLKGTLDALLVFPGGLVQRVKVGDVIGDRRVATVAINEVVLTDLKGKSPQRLAFGANAAAREQVQPQFNSANMPSNGLPPALLPPAPTSR